MPRFGHLLQWANMQVIDLEILIPASPEQIWRYLGDIAKAPQWQAGVEAVSFLTTQREGKGARWRYTQKRGADVIIEASAWYDTVGYEYKVVDGAAIGDNSGRIRLTEVTDGTVARWTLNYEPAGVLPGLRRFQGQGKRAKSKPACATCIGWCSKISALPATIRAPVSAKQPDVEQRQEYKPRHPSALDESIDEGTAPRAPIEAIEAGLPQALPAPLARECGGRRYQTQSRHPGQRRLPGYGHAARRDRGSHRTYRKPCPQHRAGIARARTRNRHPRRANRASAAAASTDAPLPQAIHPA